MPSKRLNIWTLAQPRLSPRFYGLLPSLDLVFASSTLCFARLSAGGSLAHRFFKCAKGGQNGDRRRAFEAFYFPFRGAAPRGGDSFCLSGAFNRLSRQASAKRFCWSLVFVKFNFSTITFGALIPSARFSRVKLERFPALIYFFLPN